MADDWQFREFRGASQWIVIAKRGPFLTKSPILEPGEVYFEIDVSLDRAYAKLKAEISQLEENQPTKH